MNLQTIVGLGKKGTLFKILELCQKIFSTVIVQLQQHEREREAKTRTNGDINEEQKHLFIVVDLFQWQWNKNHFIFFKSSHPHEIGVINNNNDLK